MSLKLGICTRYHQHEITRAAIQLADMSIDSGIPATIKAKNACTRDVSPYWDSRVVGPKVRMSKWSEDLTHILWTECPTRDVIQQATDNGIVPWLLALWDSVQPEHRGTLRYFDKVITPYHCMADAFSSMKSVKPYVLEWDNTLLGTAKPTIRSGAIKILVPLADSQAERVDMALFDVLDELLLMRKQLRMTVTCGRGWTIQARQRLRTLALNNPSQVSVIRTPTAFQRIQLYANHDLTLWLSQWEGMAMVGIDSIKMGTPVVAWNNAPQSEYLKTGTNAALVPCKLQHNWLGMGEVVPDYAAVKQQVLGVIDDDHFRALLQKSVLKNTECRSQKLQDKWSELWK